MTQAQNQAQELAEGRFESAKTSSSCLVPGIQEAQREPASESNPSSQSRPKQIQLNRLNRGKKSEPKEPKRAQVEATQAEPEPACMKRSPRESRFMKPKGATKRSKRSSQEHKGERDKRARATDSVKMAQAARATNSNQASVPSNVSSQANISATALLKKESDPKRAKATLNHDVLQNGRLAVSQFERAK